MDAIRTASRSQRQSKSARQNHTASRGELGIRHDLHQRHAAFHHPSEAHHHSRRARCHGADKVAFFSTILYIHAVPLSQRNSHVSTRTPTASRQTELHNCGGFIHTSPEITKYVRAPTQIMAASSASPQRVAQCRRQCFHRRVNVHRANGILPRALRQPFQLTGAGSTRSESWLFNVTIYYQLGRIGHGRKAIYGLPHAGI